ncbi:hypothetical protein BJ170DRAFT_722035 [Xylariales sp. AK1849]|nr:hypothetical protein BJ170DRAFT_722035 [Xylariales sp. AK1849]
MTSHFRHIFLFMTCLPSFCLSVYAALDHPDTPFIRTLYQYPVGTWIENLAVRSSGELLLTLLNVPQLDQLDPSQPEITPSTIHNFSGVPKAASLSGISEFTEDGFAVAVGNFTLGSGPVAGSWAIWSVDFAKSQRDKPAVRKITDLPEATFLNGMCNLPSSSIPQGILTSDIRLGVVYYISTMTGEYNVAVQDSLMATATVPVFGSSGVNGIHIHDGDLYFANTGQAIVAKMPINATSGTATGEATVIARVLNSTLQFDDFAIQGDDAYLVTGAGNSIEKIGLDGTPKGSIIAGSLNSTQFAEPTACAFGRTENDEHILYVVTAGGIAFPVNGNLTVGAQVLAVDTRMWENYCS